MVAEEQHGADLAAAAVFHRAAGGAPANVAVGVARLGVPAAFIGQVGADPFGDFLASTLAEEGVNVDHLSRSETAATALAFVSLGPGGERDFVFYRQAAADLQLTPADVSSAFGGDAAVMHVGSLSLTAEPARSATYHAISLARSKGVPVSVDPNLRLSLWPDARTARQEVLNLVAHANVLKLSEDELEFLTGAADGGAAASLMHDRMQLICVTRGQQGVEYHTREISGTVPAFAVTAVDTTGAGDAFTAGLLAALARAPGLAGDAGGPPDLPALESALRRANAFAALTVTRRGAIPAMPTLAELEAFLARGA